MGTPEHYRLGRWELGRYVEKMKGHDNRWEGRVTLHFRFNFFRPVRKLLSKHRVGAQISKRYDQPQTPYQRVVAAGMLSPAQRQALDTHFAALDPIALAADIQRTRDTLWKLAARRPAAQVEASRG